MKWECRLTGQVSDIDMLQMPETAAQNTKHSWIHLLYSGKRTADAFLVFPHKCVYSDLNNKARYSCRDAAHILSFQGQSKDAGCLRSCCRGSGVTQRAVPVQICGGLKQPRKREFRDWLWCKEQVFCFIPLQLHIYPPVSLSLLLHSPANQVMPTVSSPPSPSLTSFPISLPPLHHWITLFT